MRLALVTQAYYPVLGGVTEHVWHLGKELERRGHQVTVITGSAKHHDDRGLRVLRIGWQIPVTINGANISVTWGWKLGRALQRIEKRERFDLVHVQSPLDPGLPLIASKAMRTPKVGTYHTYRETHGFPDKIFHSFHGVFEDAYKKISRHIAVSPSAATIIHRYFPRATVDIIPNGIDIDRFGPTVEPFAEWRDGVFTILFVGRMDPRKGAKYLFAALPELEKNLKSYRIVVVGTGWMRKYYDAYIPLNLHHRVVFAGYASPDDLPRYYRSADVYCSPATGGESFGIVLLEAMASGTPVVASDIDGYRWVVEPGKEGILVPPRSPGHLAKVLVALAHDPGLRTTMAQYGREKAARYAWPKIVDQIEEIYRQVKAQPRV